MSEPPPPRPGLPRPGVYDLPPDADDGDEAPPPPRRRDAPDPGAGKPADEGAAALAPSAPRPRRRALTAFLLGLAGLIASIAALEIGFYVDWLYDRHPLAANLVAALLALTLVAGAWLAAGELRQIRRLHRAEALQARARTLLAAEGHGGGLALIAEAMALLPERPDVRANAARLRDMVHDAHSDREALALFVREVMLPLDQEAYTVVVRAARNVAVGVSISPIAALDAGITLARSLRMIRQIAQVYGFRPGTASTVAIARAILANATLSAALDVVGTVWLEHLGHRLAGVISAKLSEGVVVGVRVARLGLTTMDLCRPIPFSADDKPNMGRLRDQIFRGMM